MGQRCENGAFQIRDILSSVLNSLMSAIVGDKGHQFKDVLTPIRELWTENPQIH